MAKILPKNLQIDMLKKKLSSKGVDPDTVDLEALVDSSLSYPENEANVMDKEYMFGRMSEEEMYEESVGGQLHEDIEELKKQTVRKKEVEALINRKLKGLQKQFAIESQKVKNGQATNGSLSKLARLKGEIGKLKQYKPSLPKRQKQKLTPLSQKMEEKAVAEAIKAGIKAGYRSEYKGYGRKLAKIQIGQQQRGKPSFMQSLYRAVGGRPTMSRMERQMIQMEVEKQKRALLVKQAAHQQLQKLQMQHELRKQMRREAVRQQREMIKGTYRQPRTTRRARGRQPMMRQPMMQAPPPHMIPPHRHQPNPITGHCRICGHKAFRFI